MYSRYDSRYSVTSQSGSRQGVIAKTLAVLFLAIVTTFGVTFSLQSCGARSFVALPASSAGSLASPPADSEYSSTPVDQWQRGVVPVLYQKDPQWSSHSYAGATLSETGCGPTCLAMVYVSLTGDTTQTPATIAALATSSGCASADGTAWLFMTSGAHTLGISAEELPADKDLILMHLSSGNPIIATMGAGDFTSEGHFIVLTGISEDNRIIVHDPNSTERTQQTWNLDNLMFQFRNLWVYQQ